MTIRVLARPAALFTAAIATVLASCERAEPQAPAPVAPPAPVAAPVKPPAALTRAEILSALAKAASDHAAGIKLDTSLAGRTFVVRLPFGCFGPEPAAGVKDGLAHWTWSEDRTSIRLSASPADWTRSPLVLASGAEPPWDGVEGFWIARPWLTSETCPAPSPAAAPVAAPSPAAAPIAARSPMTAGLAAILSPEGSRLGRREGEAYSFVVRGAGETPPALPLGGYRLVLEGRIGAFPDGAAVRCTSEAPDRRPTCLAAVQLDVIAFEDAAGARLSEWRPT